MPVEFTVSVLPRPFTIWRLAPVIRTVGTKLPVPSSHQREREVARPVDRRLRVRGCTQYEVSAEEETMSVVAPNRLRSFKVNTPVGRTKELRSCGRCPMDRSRLGHRGGKRDGGREAVVHRAGCGWRAPKLQQLFLRTHRRPLFGFNASLPTERTSPKCSTSAALSASMSAAQ